MLFLTSKNITITTMIDYLISIIMIFVLISIINLLQHTSNIYTFITSFVTTGLTYNALLYCKDKNIDKIQKVSWLSKTAKKNSNLNKCCEQIWKLCLHGSMCLYEIYILNTYNWTIWFDPSLIYSPHVWSTHLDTLYVIQFGMWVYAAISHKFFEPHRKDYIIMYFHHLITLLLLALSYYAGWQEMGLLVLLVHDSSDIMIDLLKIFNYMSLDGYSNYFIVEQTFILNLLYWLWSRLYIFPLRIIQSTFPYDFIIPGPVFIKFPLFSLCNYCRILLVFLFCLHCWWFFLILRIGFRMICAESGHSAAAAEYEGSSDSD